MEFFEKRVQKMNLSSAGLIDLRLRKMKTSFILRVTNMVAIFVAGFMIIGRQSPDFAVQWVHAIPSAVVSGWILVIALGMLSYWATSHMIEATYKVSPTTAVIPPKTKTGTLKTAKRTPQVRTATHLAATHPEIAMEWDWVGNDEKPPTMVSAGSKQVVAWVCSKTPEHKWHASLKSRTTGGKGCPFCLGLQTDAVDLMGVPSPHADVMYGSYQKSL